MASLKGVILRINPNANIIDITHAIQPQNILSGAYVMFSTIPYFPPAIHVGVVDPGVGSERKAIVIQCERGYMVGPDNGLLIPCARLLGIKRIFKISNKKYLNDHISDTFHGRDVFAPVAAHISEGVSVSEFGPEISDSVNLELEEFRKTKDSISGKFIFQDTFGNLIFSIPKAIVLKHFTMGDEIDIIFRYQGEEFFKKLPLLPSYAHQKPNKLLATISSSGFFEIACNLGSAQTELQMGPGTEISLKL